VSIMTTLIHLAREIAHPIFRYSRDHYIETVCLFCRRHKTSKCTVRDNEIGNNHPVEPWASCSEITGVSDSDCFTNDVSFESL